MSESESGVSGAELGRWLILAVLILCCVGLFFWLTPHTRPIVHPPVSEEAP